MCSCDAENPHKTVLDVGLSRSMFAINDGIFNVFSNLGKENSHKSGFETGIHFCCDSIVRVMRWTVFGMRCGVPIVYGYVMDKFSRAYC